MLTGQTVRSARWKRGLHAVAGGDFQAEDRFARFGSMGFGVGELYTARYFPASAKAKIQELVQNVTAAYRKRIESLDWMSAPTRQEALKKLDTYRIKVGYPDHARDYSKLVIRDDDLLGDAERTGAFDWQFYVDRMKGPVDKTEWVMTPQTNDAYNGSLRDIVFPAGILQPPIFDPNADPAVNYGAAGAVIGHELTHASTTRDGSSTPPARCAIGGSPPTRRHSTREPQRSRRSTMASRRFPIFTSTESSRSARTSPTLAALPRTGRVSRVAARKTRAGIGRPHRRPARLPRLGASLGREVHGRIHQKAGDDGSA